jgi:ABC-type phosphate transport system permease subunit
MILGKVYIAGEAIIWVVPVGIDLVVFMQMFAPKPLGKTLRWTVEFMTGITTDVYGFAAPSWRETPRKQSA